MISVKEFWVGLTDQSGHEIVMASRRLVRFVSEPFGSLSPSLINDQPITFSGFVAVAHGVGFGSDASSPFMLVTTLAGSQFTHMMLTGEKS